VEYEEKYNENTFLHMKNAYKTLLKPSNHEHKKRGRQFYGIGCPKSSQLKDFPLMEPKYSSFQITAI
jgi:hypothetical protein